MKTKLCDDCRATGSMRDTICLLCKGSGYVTSCDDCVPGKVCLTCEGREWCPIEEDDEYAVKCRWCEGVGEQLCRACLGGSVVLMDGSPLARLAAKQKFLQV
jgi:hypothetical protein